MALVANVIDDSADTRRKIQNAHTLKMGIVFGNGNSIPNLLRQLFHSRIKIKCFKKM